MARARGLEKSLHSKEQAAFRALLAEARQNVGLTQQDLAKKLNKPQSFIAKYENGERRLDVVEFIAIARALGADPVRLLRSLIKRLG